MLSDWTAWLSYAGPQSLARHQRPFRWLKAPPWTDPRLVRLRWTECDMAVNADFHSDFMLNYNMLLPPMLADGVRIMIYIGMQVSTALPL